MNYAYIDTESSLRDFCRQATGAEFLGFDTEFVSEHTFEPELCLLQIAADGELAIIDPQPIEDLTPFWELLASPGHVTVVHAGREELLFSTRATGQVPFQLFDLQLAAGFIGLEYPASYGTLIQRLLGQRLAKGETRTDWRKRPLTDSQLEYAIQDVLFLQAMYDTLLSQLDSLGRSEWLRDEMILWQDRVVERSQHENWRRVSGSNGLSQRCLAIVRELWRWRKQEAQRRNKPVKRVLRDDLIVELARRQTDDTNRIKAIRGMDRGDLRRCLSEIAAAIARALVLDDDELPQRSHKSSQRQLATIGQFMHMALNGICRSESISPGIVATVDDVRDFVASHCGLDRQNNDEPILKQGWREEIAGDRLRQLLQGRITVRVGDPLADDPLLFEIANDEKGE